VIGQEPRRRLRRGRIRPGVSRLFKRAVK
jgi:hypothetical protein